MIARSVPWKPFRGKTWLCALALYMVMAGLALLGLALK
jgi:hypothetical protein